MSCGGSSRGRCQLSRILWLGSQDAWCERMSVTFDLRQCGPETGEVEVMELAGNNNAATSTAFLRQLRGDTSNR